MHGIDPQNRVIAGRDRVQLPALSTAHTVNVVATRGRPLSDVRCAPSGVVGVAACEHRCQSFVGYVTSSGLQDRCRRHSRSRQACNECVPDSAAQQQRRRDWRCVGRGQARDSVWRLGPCNTCQLAHLGSIGSPIRASRRGTDTSECHAVGRTIADSSIGSGPPATHNDISFQLTLLL